MADPRETYRCMEKTCGQAFTAPTRLRKALTTVLEGRGVHCARCYGTYVEWVNFHTDWEYLESTNEWKRKEFSIEEWRALVDAWKNL